MTLEQVKSVMHPGDVFAVRTNGTDQDVIEFGEGLQGKVNTDDHVAGFIYWDGDIPWGLEGRPGGVGWVDMRKYIGKPFTFNNCLQPNRMDPQRILISEGAKAMIGTKYDWAMIGGSALAALHVKLFHLSWPHGMVPGEVVCSSYWAYLYSTANWAHPSTNDERECAPADWAAFMNQNYYHIGLEL